MYEPLAVVSKASPLCPSLSDIGDCDLDPDADWLLHRAGQCSNFAICCRQYQPSGRTRPRTDRRPTHFDHHFCVLLSKEIISALVQFGQKFYGEKLRILVSQDLAQSIIEKFLSYRLAFFNADQNQAGKLQTRIDRGIGSLTRLVQIFFIDILPLFSSAIVALGLMYYANVYVGLVATSIIPIYFWLTFQQAKKLGGWRRNLRDGREKKSQGILSIIQSISVIKSFNRESIESTKQLKLQKALTDNQMQTRQLSFLFDGLKTFIEQIGIVLIIILTAYFVLDGKMSIGMIMFHILLFGGVSKSMLKKSRLNFDKIEKCK